MDQWTIKSGEQIASESVALRKMKRFIGLVVPENYGSAGNITFLASKTKEGTYYPVYDSSGTKVSVTVSDPGGIYSLTGTQLEAMAGLSFVKISVAAAAAEDLVIDLIAKVNC